MRNTDFRSEIPVLNSGLCTAAQLCHLELEAWLSEPPFSPMRMVKSPVLVTLPMVPVPCHGKLYVFTQRPPRFQTQTRHSDQIRSDQSLSRVRLFVTPLIAACQASLSITNSWSSLRLTSIESVMPSSHLILCHPLSSCSQSLPASQCFPMSQLFT